jgi:hypothetical protein
VLALEGAQLVEQGVVLPIPDQRVIEDVVAMIVVRDLAPQLRGTRLRGHGTLTARDATAVSDRLGHTVAAPWRGDPHFASIR